MDIIEVEAYSEETRLALQHLLWQLNPQASVLTGAALSRIIAADATHLLLAVKRGRICGTATIVIMEVLAGKRARIEDVVVAEAMRRQGIGRKLVARAVQLAREKGAFSIELTSHPSRQSANALYLGLGFRLRETNTYTYDLT